MCVWPEHLFYCLFQGHNALTSTGEMVSILNIVEVF